MNWAELHEISDTLKSSHSAVHYGGGTTDEHCGNCKNFIPGSIENRCRTVQCPIGSDMWCNRYERN